MGAREDVVPSIIAALLLVGHGLVHASFVSPAPALTSGGPAWPFDLGRSWLLGPLGLAPEVTRALGIALLLPVVAGYLVAALTIVGLAPGAWFAPAVVGATVASAIMLALFFHPWLVAGLVIDAVLLWATLARGWTPGAVG